MNNSDFYIKLSDHFKLYVLLKDHIKFESVLMENNIKFYFDDYQVLHGVNKRYFFLSSDAHAIDEILKQNDIIASTETIEIVDYRDGRKAMRLYLWVALAVIATMILIILIEKI